MCVYVAWGAGVVLQIEACERVACFLGAVSSSCQEQNIKGVISFHVTGVLDEGGHTAKLPRQVLLSSKIQHACR